jgi:toxin ParE1/3/4
MTFNVVLDKRALNDIQSAIDYYDEQSIGLGSRFSVYLDKQIQTLKKRPYFQIRYDAIHCLPLKKFPFMLHYSINEEVRTVQIHALVNTNRNP